tara:strand:- start:49 stop:525 length:477 start_codon:yes stop_codon:yes gene_type:complete
MNYISVIYEEHTKNPYCLGGVGVGACTTCGCFDVRKRIFDFLISELEIEPKEIGTKYHKGLANVKSGRVLKQMIENLCNNLNKLGSEYTVRMDYSFLEFIIMEIWSSLRMIYREDQREEALKYFLDLIDNQHVISFVKAMDMHFRKHHFRKDPTKNQF